MEIKDLLTPGFLSTVAGASIAAGGVALGAMLTSRLARERDREAELRRRRVECYARLRGLSLAMYNLLSVRCQAVLQAELWFRRYEAAEEGTAEEKESFEEHSRNAEEANRLLFELVKLEREYHELLATIQISFPPAGNLEEVLARARAIRLRDEHLFPQEVARETSIQDIPALLEAADERIRCMVVRPVDELEAALTPVART